MVREELIGIIRSLSCVITSCGKWALDLVKSTEPSRDDKRSGRTMGGRMTVEYNVSRCASRIDEKANHNCVADCDEALLSDGIVCNGKERCGECGKSTRQMRDNRNKHFKIE